MKIALEVSNKTLPNKVFEKAIISLSHVMRREGLEATVYTSSELPNNADGYVFLPYLTSTKTKREILRSNKPFMTVSNCFFPKYSTKMVRILINGNTPGYGNWNTASGESKWKQLDLQPKLCCRKRRGKTAIISPASLHSDITYGSNPAVWSIDLAKFLVKKYDKVIIKTHPKIKDSIRQQAYVKLLYKFKHPKLEIVSSGNLRSLSTVVYDDCHNYTSTASIEAALAGKKVQSYSPGDFMYEGSNIDRFHQISACLWAPEDMAEFWFQNRDRFMANVIDLRYPEYIEQVDKFLGRT